MKTGLIYKIGGGEHYEPRIAFWCVGCNCAHEVELAAQKWQLSGTEEKPTIVPSIRIFNRQGEACACHVVVTDGMLNYCPDCQHELAGKSVPMEKFIL